MTEDEMVGWPHRLDGHEFEQTSGVGDGQGTLVCCSPWGHEESDTTERLPFPFPFSHLYMTTGKTIALIRQTFVGKVMVFPVVMYGCESWTIKKAEHRRISASTSVLPMNIRDYFL